MREGNVSGGSAATCVSVKTVNCIIRFALTGLLSDLAGSILKRRMS
jgi:hypothetical protein